jgi:hypothetical protein
MDGGVNTKVVEVVRAMSPMQMIISVIILGMLTGGSGHFVLEAVATVISDPDPTTDRLQTSLDSLNVSIRQLNRSTESTAELLTRTRCEVQAIRDEFNWLECWAPEP